MKINLMCLIIIKKNVLYLIIHSNQKKMEKTNETKRELTFNEWVTKYNVSSNYVEPTKYYQGNQSSGFKPMEIETTFQRFIRLLGF